MLPHLPLKFLSIHSPLRCANSCNFRLCNYWRGGVRNFGVDCNLLIIFANDCTLTPLPVLPFLKKLHFWRIFLQQICVKMITAAHRYSIKIMKITKLSSFLDVDLFLRPYLPCTVMGSWSTHKCKAFVCSIFSSIKIK